MECESSTLSEKTFYFDSHKMLGFSFWKLLDYSFLITSWMFVRLNSITSDKNFLYWFSRIIEARWTESFTSWVIMTLPTTVYNLSSLSSNRFDYVENSWTRLVTFFWNFCSNGWLFSWWPFVLKLTLVINEAITGPDIIHYISAFALSRISTTPPSDLISLLFCSCAWSSDMHENNRLVLFTVKNPFWNSSKTVRWIRCNFLNDFK